MDEQSKRLKESTEVQEVDYLGTSEMRKQGQFGYSDRTIQLCILVPILKRDEKAAVHIVISFSLQILGNCITFTGRTGNKLIGPSSL